MSASKVEKYRFWISLFIEPLEVGQTFTPQELHLTLIPWFVADMPDELIVKKFQETFVELTKFTVEVGAKEDFHPRREVNVNLIEPSHIIESLHGLSMKLFRDIDARWAVQNPYVENQYRPHIRRRGNGRPRKGDKISFDTVYLIKVRRQEDNVREVAAKVGLL